MFDSLFVLIGIKTVFRLRLELSQFKCHKKRHNFLDTPSDLCQEAPEDSFHFLLRCNSYANCRQTLLDEVQIILRKRILRLILMCIYMVITKSLLMTTRVFYLHPSGLSMNLHAVCNRFHLSHYCKYVVGSFSLTCLFIVIA